LCAGNVFMSCLQETLSTSRLSFNTSRYDGTRSSKETQRGRSTVSPKVTAANAKLCNAWNVSSFNKLIFCLRFHVHGLGSAHEQLPWESLSARQTGVVLATSRLWILWPHGASGFHGHMVAQGCYMSLYPNSTGNSDLDSGTFSHLESTPHTAHVQLPTCYPLLLDCNMHFLCCKFFQIPAIISIHFSTAITFHGGGGTATEAHD
jgi:hypothetical protein